MQKEASFYYKILNGQHYIAGCRRANPRLFDRAGTVKISSEELLRQLGAAFDAGRADLRAELRAAAGMPSDLPLGGGEDYTCPPGFETLFGRS